MKRPPTEPASIGFASVIDAKYCHMRIDHLSHGSELFSNNDFHSLFAEIACSRITCAAECYRPNMTFLAGSGLSAHHHRCGIEALGRLACHDTVVSGDERQCDKVCRPAMPHSNNHSVRNVIRSVLESSVVVAVRVWATTETY